MGIVEAYVISMPSCSGTFLLFAVERTIVALYGTLHVREGVGGKDAVHERNKMPFTQLAPESVKYSVENHQ